MKRQAIIFAVVLSAAAGIYAGYDPYYAGSAGTDAAEYTYGINNFGKTYALYAGRTIDSAAAANIADLFMQTPGLYFMNSGLLNFGSGAYAGSIANIRGLGGGMNSGIVTFVDGRPQYMTFYKSPLFDTLALDDVETVELLKGPASVEYGNMAVNGAVNITTRLPAQEGMKTKIKTSAGSYFTQNYYLSNMMKSGAYDYSVSGGYKSTAGFRPDSGSGQQNYSVKAGYSYSQEIRYGAGASYNDVTYYNPGPEGSVWDREQEAVKIKTVSWDVRAEKISPDFKGRLLFYSDSGSNDFMKSTAPSGVTMPGSDITFANYGIKLVEEWNLIPGNVIKLGFDWQNFGGTFKDYPYAPDIQKNDKRFENDYAPYFILAQKVGITGIMLGVRYAYNDRWGHEFIPQAGLTFSLYTGNEIYFNVSKGYSTPAMAAVISPFENLKPEDYWQYEAGVEQVFGDFFDLIVTAYQTEGQNTLRDTDPGPALKYSNSGFTLVRGLETSLQVKIKDVFKIGGSASYCEPGDKSADTQLLTAGTFLEFNFGKVVGLRASAEFGKNRYAADKKLEKLGDYMYLNASADVKADFLGNGSSFFVEASNLLDAEYEVKKGYPAPGFIIKGGMVLKL